MRTSKRQDNEGSSVLFQKETHLGRVNIKSYAPGEINISGKIYTTPVLINEQRIETVPYSDFGEIDLPALESLIPEQVEVFLIGTGDKHLMLDPKVVHKINQKGIAIEVMSSRNACHTFQVLMYEKRIVSAILFP